MRRQRNQELFRLVVAIESLSDALQRPLTFSVKGGASPLEHDDEFSGWVQYLRGHASDVSVYAIFSV